MSQVTSAPTYLPAIATRTKWSGYRHALARTAYAVLLVLVMLLPANFIAAMIATSVYHGDALLGARYAITHHLAGYWVIVGEKATAVTAGAWWATAVWEGLFWASCASGLALVGLWLGRSVVLRLRPWELLAAWRDR
jgi:hypothetical protein